MHTQLCRSASVHSQRVCVCMCGGMCGMQSRSCHCCLPLAPLLAANPTRLQQCVVWSAAFVFKRASRKQIICTQYSPVPVQLLPFLSPSLRTHNKLTAIKRFCQNAAGMGRNLRADGCAARGRGTLLELSASPRKL